MFTRYINYRWLAARCGRGRAQSLQADSRLSASGRYLQMAGQRALGVRYACKASVARTLRDLDPDWHASTGAFFFGGVGEACPWRRISGVSSPSGLGRMLRGAVKRSFSAHWADKDHAVSEPLSQSGKAPKVQTEANWTALHR